MNKHILVVEDEPDLREAMVEVLIEAGFNVSAAPDGSIGLDYAIAEKPDLILMDLMMPIMDGHEMLRRLRQDPWGRNAHVVVLSAMDDVSNIAHAHEGKLEDYIIKAHASLDELVNKVREFIAINDSK
jgi:DNA-binding response OmpR family regulator